VSGGMLAGITLASGDDCVRVTSVTRSGSMFRSGIRTGCEIVAINNIPVSNHEIAISIVDACQDARQTINVTLKHPGASRCTLLCWNGCVKLPYATTAIVRVVE